MAFFCRSCGALINDESAAFCPACGAPVKGSKNAAPKTTTDRPVSNAAGSSDNIPRTIDELKAFAAWHRLPLQDMRFFLGENYPGPRAFGIYRDPDDGLFVVYKNKADGSRAIRYRGHDEATAVNELYLKMKDEIILRRKKAAGIGAQEYRTRSNADLPETRNTSQKKKSSSAGMTVLGIILAIAAVITVIRVGTAIHKKVQNGYYQYNGGTYYSQNNDWYLYSDPLGSWFPVSSVDDALYDNPDDYYLSSYYTYDYGVSDFSESSYYQDYSSSSSDSGSSWSSGSSDSDWDWDWDDDSDWDWDSDSDWDWGDTDWDSDW